MSTVGRMQWVSKNEALKLVQGKPCKICGAPAAIMSDMPSESRMIKMAGMENSLQAWELLDRAAAETCAACDLNDLASAQMCKDCPAVELLKRLGKLAECDKK